MTKLRQLFFVDVNLVLDYPDIIPNPGQPVILDHPSTDLRQGTIVIPLIVIYQLDRLSLGNHDRSKTARELLRRIRLFCSLDQEPDLLCDLANPRIINGQEIAISRGLIEDFRARNDLSSEVNVDNEIIFAVLRAKRSDFESVILTNHDGLAIVAASHNIRTKKFHYYKHQYNGRRDLSVPADFLEEFIANRKVPYQAWRQALPNQPKLIANEYLLMTGDDYTVNCFERYEQYRNIGRYDAESDSIVPLQNYNTLPVKPKNAGQAIYLESLLSDQIRTVIAYGPAGTGKTFLTTIYAYEACRNGEFLDAVVVPCNVQDNIGFLPGDIDEKLGPNIAPFKNALRNFLLHHDKDILKKIAPKGKKSKKVYGVEAAEPLTGKHLRERLEDQVELIWKNSFSSVPIDYARGRDFSMELAILDEFQDQTNEQADTLIKRLGTDGKIIITGDVEQLHNTKLTKSQNGLTYAQDLLKDHPMVAQINFLEHEVVRHPLVKEVVKRQTA